MYSITFFMKLTMPYALIFRLLFLLVLLIVTLCHFYVLKNNEEFSRGSCVTPIPAISEFHGSVLLSSASMHQTPLKIGLWRLKIRGLGHGAT